MNSIHQVSASSCKIFARSPTQRKLPTSCRFLLQGVSFDMQVKRLLSLGEESRQLWWAGRLDLWSAGYLPFCDIFVTHETKKGGQLSALRFLNVFNRRTPPTHVLR
jgi:hypothetical protein